MTLVMVAVQKGFILAGADQLATQGNQRLEHPYTKVFKISPAVILCIAGDVSDNQILFSDYLKYNDDKTNLIISHYYSNLSYLNVLQGLNERFASLSIDKDNGEPRHFYCFACGWGNTGFQACEYQIIDREKSSWLIDPDPNNNMPCLAGSIELEIHKANFKKVIGDQKPRIKNLKTAFNDVLNKGICFDESIDNNPLFETIVLSDIE